MKKRTAALVVLGGVVGAGLAAIALTLRSECNSGNCLSPKMCFNGRCILPPVSEVQHSVEDTFG